LHAEREFIDKVASSQSDVGDDVLVEWNHGYGTSSKRIDIESCRFISGDKGESESWG